MRDDAWFAGFVDGEGCFYVSTPGTPALKVTLRADDVAVLALLREEFGGGISFAERTGEFRAPQATLTIASKRDLAALVAYFDAHPLRSKKARDYAIWREAVRVYCARGKAAPELRALRQALQDVRKFGVESIEIPDTVNEMLSLFEA